MTDTEFKAQTVQEIVAEQEKNSKKQFNLTLANLLSNINNKKHDNDAMYASFVERHVALQSKILESEAKYDSLTSHDRSALIVAINKEAQELCKTNF